MKSYFIVIYLILLLFIVLAAESVNILSRLLLGRKIIHRFDL